MLNINYFGVIKALVNEGINNIEQQLRGQQDTNTKINLIQVLVSKAFDLYYDLKGSKEYLYRIIPTEEKRLEITNELKEISEKLAFNFKEVFHCLQDDVQIDNYLRLLSVIRLKNYINL